MPLYDLQCASCGRPDEVFLQHWDDPNPPCRACSGTTERMVSRFATVFMKSIHNYTDPNRENAGMDGWWAFKKRSSVSGQPEPVYIDSMQTLKEFNRAEGLAAPGEIPTNSTVSADGKRILSDGLPGQWRGSMPPIPARLQEMIDVKAEDCSPMPATSTPAMPMDYGVRAEVAAEVPAEAGQV